MKFAHLEPVVESEGDPPVPKPIASPVTVAEWVQQGRLNPQTAETQPVLVQRQLNAAVSHCQNWCRRSFCTQKLKARYLADGKSCSCAGVILLPRGKVQSVEEITVDGTPVDSTGYTLDGNVLTLATPPGSGSVWVTWSSGYGPDGAWVPDGVKEGIYEYATLLHEFRWGERPLAQDQRSGGTSVIHFMPPGIEDILREFQLEIEG